MADLGFLHFYFSCKHYQELAQARITKVVGSFTTNPTKLSLHFSEFPTIFDAIYKILQNSNTIWDSLLHRGPWKGLGSYKYALNLWIRPHNEQRSRNVVLGAAAGAGGEIPASSGGGVDRGRAWGWSGGALGSISTLVGAVVAPTSSLGGTGRRPPRWCTLRRGRGNSGATRGGLSFYGV
jgi:hypothetical protein